MSQDDAIPCPHRPDFDAAGGALSKLLPRLLETIDIADRCDVTIVLVSRVCGCTVTVSESPEHARAAAEALTSSTEKAERAGVVAGSDNVVHLRPVSK